MKLLKTIYPYEVDPKSPEYDYSSFTLRPAVRAVVFDKLKVALIDVKNGGYYMLPGGGIDEDEDMLAALAREVREELGCEVTGGAEVGQIVTYIDRWKSRQVDHCFTAQFVPSDTSRELTAFETEAGYELVWAGDLDEAIELVRHAKPVARDGLLIRERDATFLEKVKHGPVVAELHTTSSGDMASSG